MKNLIYLPFSCSNIGSMSLSEAEPSEEESPASTVPRLTASRSYIAVVYCRVPFSMCRRTHMGNSTYLSATLWQYRTSFINARLAGSAIITSAAANVALGSPPEWCSRPARSQAPASHQQVGAHVPRFARSGLPLHSGRLCFYACASGLNRSSPPP